MKNQFHRGAGALVWHLAGALLIAAWQPATAQSIAVPSAASPPRSAELPFPIRAGGALADATLSRMVASTVMDPPETTRGSADGTNLEQVFASRCRAVVLVVAITGTGSEQRVGSGTGSIVSAQGLILTAAHVIAGADKIAVGVLPTCAPGAQPEPFTVSVVKVDATTDLALLKLESLPKDMSVMPTGDMNSIRPGTLVVMIGHPKGLLMSMSQGVVSAIRPSYKWTPQGGADMQATVIQTDGAINRGNSCGPRMTQYGELIGVNSFILGQASAGLNFAVSVEDVKVFYARTSSRPPASSHPAAAASSPSVRQNDSCKPKVMKEWAEGAATRKAIDLDCKGRANSLLVLPDDPGQRSYLLWDRNGDGKADAKFYLNRAGKPEYSEWDDDFDGAYDFQAEHEGGDWEPKTKTRIASR